MTDWGTVAVILSLWPLEMLGTSYLVVWLLKRQFKNVWKVEVKREKKWKWPFSDGRG